MSDGKHEQSLDALRIQADVGEFEQQLDEIARSPDTDRSIPVVGLHYQATCIGL